MALNPKHFFGLQLMNQNLVYTGFLSISIPLGDLGYYTAGLHISLQYRCSIALHAAHYSTISSS